MKTSTMCFCPFRCLSQGLSRYLDAVEVLAILPIYPINRSAYAKAMKRQLAL
jgi:hypothetical protein